jgi:ferritin-like metal-binding protein YciE
MGAVQGMMNKLLQDTLVKDAIADFAAENFEIASYKALIQSANAIGEQKVATVCEEILRDEQEMARWLEEHLSPAVNEALEGIKADVR